MLPTMSAFVDKPFNPKDLRTLVAGIISRKT